MAGGTEPFDPESRVRVQNSSAERLVLYLHSSVEGNADLKLDGTLACGLVTVGKKPAAMGDPENAAARPVQVPLEPGQTRTLSLEGNKAKQTAAWINLSSLPGCARPYSATWKYQLAWGGPAGSQCWQVSVAEVPAAEPGAPSMEGRVVGRYDAEARLLRFEVAEEPLAGGPGAGGEEVKDPAPGRSETRMAGTPVSEGPHPGLALKAGAGAPRSEGPGSATVTGFRPLGQPLAELTTHTATTHSGHFAARVWHHPGRFSISRDLGRFPMRQNLDVTVWALVPMRTNAHVRLVESGGDPFNRPQKDWLLGGSNGWQTRRFPYSMQTEANLCLELGGQALDPADCVPCATFTLFDDVTAARCPADGKSLMDEGFENGLGEWQQPPFGIVADRVVASTGTCVNGCGGWQIPDRPRGGGAVPYGVSCSLGALHKAETVVISGWVKAAKGNQVGLGFEDADNGFHHGTIDLATGEWQWLFATLSPVSHGPGLLPDTSIRLLGAVSGDPYGSTLWSDVRAVNGHGESLLVEPFAPEKHAWTGDHKHCFVLPGARPEGSGSQESKARPVSVSASGTDAPV
jgi:hypothetical protein